MDLSPPPEDIQPPYHQSSTPLTHLPSRKRKHDETLEISMSPKFSSTLNESLITELKDICLVGSVPNTPEKQRSLLNKAVVSSPIQESRKILYSTIKVVKPERKFGLLRNRYVPYSNQNLLTTILTNNLIMDIIFKYLSGGDLFRFSLVSRSFYNALERNQTAFERYKIYKSNYKDNKENYVITPPGSPEKCDSPPRTNSDNLNKYIRVAKCLNRDQHLSKCRRCGDIAIIENEIAQCQNINSCGLIYCLRCSSSSETGAKDFKDACGHAILRPKLGNMSNQMECSFFNFSNQDSGFYSENETPPKVKRNLFFSKSETPKVLAVKNKTKKVVMDYKRDTISYVPVVPNNERIRTPVDGDSPPRYGYAVGSKQSKKNLKRLTR